MDLLTYLHLYSAGVHNAVSVLGRQLLVKDVFSVCFLNCPTICLVHRVQLRLWV